MSIYSHICFVVRNKETKNLSNKMEKEKRDDTASLTAQAHGVSAAYVRMIVNGVRKNESILSTYNKILRAKEKLSQPLESPSESTK